MLRELKNHMVRYGFVWGPENNPYGVSGFMTYAPLGKKLKTRIETEFHNVLKREGFDEIETPVIYPEAAWKASGHLDKFSREMFHTQTYEQRKLVGRTEMATTVFPLFRSLLDFYGRMPFKVYQTGIVLPNDRQTEWQVRTRQYTGHEGYIFFEHSYDTSEKIAYMKLLAFKLMEALEIPKGKLEFREKNDKERPFYAKEAYGLYAALEDGPLEVLGIQYRGSDDFQKHSKATGKVLKFGEEYPNVIEISFSSERPFFLTMYYALESGEKPVLHLPQSIAPISTVILPLKNTAELREWANALQSRLRKNGIDAPVVVSGEIGKRYRKADAIGVPFAFVVDYRTLEDGSVTLRERDTAEQVRISTENLDSTLEDAKITDTLKDLYKSGTGL